MLFSICIDYTDRPVIRLPSTPMENASCSWKLLQVHAVNGRKQQSFLSSSSCVVSDSVDPVRPTIQFDTCDVCMKGLDNGLVHQCFKPSRGFLLAWVSFREIGSEQRVVRTALVAC